MTNIVEFRNRLGTDKKMQAELFELEPEAGAYTAYANRNGFCVTLSDVEAIFKDLFWLARVGDDIDHA
ncbi:hypothetical protein [Pseudomonas caricapapayae]|uniref:hypothetical protein n=1 Tax=Pseudomonas caricapapayae TaxID=46678 RepID=UPI0006D624A1|nr:hypothetical protein [Pseudomonas caricapapayae]KAA8694271.1 hypothetical protein F4W67_17105 [Pseudomonas caricapapayae]